MEPFQTLYSTGVMMNTLTTVNLICKKEDTLHNLGGKAFNLQILGELGLNVPEWFAIRSDAIFESLPAEIRTVWNELDNEKKHQILAGVNASPALMNQVWICVDKFNSGACTTYAVRSSSPDEDGKNHSFAGQFESVVGVERSKLASAIHRVWMSAFAPGVSAYRRLASLGPAKTAPAVIIQRLVNATVAGVAFGADPVTGDESVSVITAVNGLADKLVSGEVDCASYRVSSSMKIERTSEELGSLTDEQIFLLCTVLELLKKRFGTSQDVEWAIEDGKLYVLQSRPITSMPGKNMKGSEELSSGQVEERQAPADLCIDLWDNSNIGESYPGVTTPLTFSFARKAYEHVYLEFCKLMGVDRATIKESAGIFPQMLGFVRGRIYYNLLNWYRLLSMFPLFKVNQGFMEQMMGTGESLPDVLKKEFELKRRSRTEKIGDLIALSAAMVKMFYSWLMLPCSTSAFYQRVDSSLARLPQDLSIQSPGELCNQYRTLEKCLLQKWDAPIVNDFFAMIFFGLLKSLSSKWLKDEGIHNQLLSFETGIISTEPARLQKELALMASTDERLLLTLRENEISNIELQLADFPQFQNAVKDYLTKFGDRCIGELKLESPTLEDNLPLFFRSIAKLAETASADSELRSTGAAQRALVELEVANKLGRNPLKRFVFSLVLKQARERIKGRENLRFERTRVFGAVRKIFLAIGKNFADKGILECQRDIFFLETEEILRFIEGTSTTRNLKNLVATRKFEFESNCVLSAPPDRFYTTGGVNLDTTIPLDLSNKSKQTANGDSLSGIGCASGIVRAKARLVTDPSECTGLEDEILIAERTDPGWITLIAQAKGIVVEYGSLLSHTAIVARELGIPTVVSAKGVLKCITDGDLIEIDGATGTVRIIQRCQPESQQANSDRESHAA
ncbi:MAG: phosphoenolpyruvate synthase [Cyanobacteria bacterium]|nr:phosphoenolpyruvate synthase [Cyanobacteriota bacterium]